MGQYEDEGGGVVHGLKKLILHLSHFCSKDALARGVSAYGMVEIYGDIAYYVGRWQRVEIIALKVILWLHYFCRLVLIKSEALII